MDKKASSLPLNTIVIAVIVLIVLVVIIVIFGGGTSKFAGGVKSCQSAGGLYSGKWCFDDCNNLIGDSPPSLYKPGAIIVAIPGTECENTKQVCCRLVTGEKITGS